MKKIPILLLALTLASMGSVTLTGRAGAIDEGENTLVANLYDKRVKFVSVNPVKGSYDVYLEAGYMSGYRVQEMYVATFDHTKVTMEEADKLAMTLGEEGASTAWTKSRVYRSYASMTVSGFATDGVFRTGLLDNYSDVLYYAVLFVDRSGANGEPIWVRGKLDYRDCIHASSFDEETGTVCYARQTGDIYDFSLSNWMMGEEEKILSWEEELTDLARGELVPTIQALERLEFDKEQGQNIFAYDVELVRRALNNALVKIEALKRTDEMSEEVAALEVRMEKLLQDDDKDDSDNNDSSTDGKDDGVNGDDKEDGSDEDKGEVDDFDASGDIGDIENVGGFGGANDVDDKNNTEDDIESDVDVKNNATSSPTEAGVEHDTIQGGNGEAVVVAPSVAETIGLPNDVNRLEGEVIGVTSNLVGDEDTQNEISIPKLGGEMEGDENRGWWSRFFWAIILAIIGGIGVVIWWVKKGFFSEDSEK